MIKNIFFDLDDTIYDLMEPFQRACLEFFDDFSLPCEDVFLVSRKYCDEIYPLGQRGKYSQDEMFIYRICHTFADFGVTVSEQGALEFQVLYKKYQKQISMPEISKEMLLWCRDHMDITGIITNGLPKSQWGKVEILGLTNYIPKEHIIVSGDTKWAKPEPELFLEAAKRFNISPEETWYAGDDYINDVTGPKSAGWHSIWYNHRRRIPLDSDYRPDQIATDGKDLLETIKKL